MNESINIIQNFECKKTVSVTKIIKLICTQYYTAATVNLPTFNMYDTLYNKVRVLSPFSFNCMMVKMTNNSCNMNRYSARRDSYQSMPILPRLVKNETIPSKMNRCTQEKASDFLSNCPPRSPALDFNDLHSSRRGKIGEPISNEIRPSILVQVPNLQNNSWPSLHICRCKL